MVVISEYWTIAPKVNLELSSSEPLTTTFTSIENIQPCFMYITILKMPYLIWCLYINIELMANSTIELMPE